MRDRLLPACVYKRYHTSSESNTRVLFVLSANVILNNSTVNKKLILCYILNTILSFCFLFFYSFCSVLPTKILSKATAQQKGCASLSRWCLVSEWICVLYESCESMIQSPIHKEREPFTLFMNESAGRMYEWLIKTFTATCCHFKFLI